MCKYTRARCILITIWLLLLLLLCAGKLVIWRLFSHIKRVFRHVLRIHLPIYSYVSNAAAQFFAASSFAHAWKSFGLLTFGHCWYTPTPKPVYLSLNSYYIPRYTYVYLTYCRTDHTYTARQGRPEGKYPLLLCIHNIEMVECGDLSVSWLGANAYSWCVIINE